MTLCSKIVKILQIITKRWLNFFSIPTLRSRQLVWKISQSISEKEMANKDREKDEMGFQITRRGQGDRFLSKDVCWAFQWDRQHRIPISKIFARRARYYGFGKVICCVWIGKKIWFASSGRPSSSTFFYYFMRFCRFQRGESKVSGRSEYEKIM